MLEKMERADEESKAAAAAVVAVAGEEGLVWDLGVGLPSSEEEGLLCNIICPCYKYVVFVD